MDSSIVEVYACLERRHWWLRARRRIVRRQVDARFGRDRRLRVLEVGCGSGENLRALADRSDVMGIEPDDTLRAVGNSMGAEIVAGSLPDDLPDDLGDFDLILLLDVLEHVGDDVRALDVCGRLLRPGGAVLVTTPAMPWLWSQHDVLAGHHRRYTLPALREASHLAGLHAERLGHCNFVLFAPFVLSRLWSKLFTPSHPYRIALPPRPINALLEACMGIEAGLITRCTLPWGGSIMGWLVAETEVE